MSFLNKIGLTWFIHIFSILHAVTAFLCYFYQVGDELFLTVLTMALILIVCLKQSLSIEFTASFCIVGNILGYLMGTWVAHMLNLAVESPIIVHSISTFITTEALGWSILAVAGIFRLGRDSDRNAPVSSPYFKWLLLAVGGIFLLRLGVIFLFSHEQISSRNVYDIVRVILSNSVGLIILIFLNILYVRYSGHRMTGSSRGRKILFLIGFTALASLLEAFIAGSGLPFTFNKEFPDDFPLILTISVITQITAYCIIFIINYAFTARSEMQKQKERAHSAQYRYMKLKGQVNPHFLFNCLNILDCLVLEGKNGQASTYIHKLAGIYRYMLKSEDEELVPLRDELVFVGLYVDLLKVRFPEGFEVETDVPEDLMSRFILPCSLQLLIENATKHNAVSADNPLMIRIEASEDSISIINNIIPKISSSQSTGVGHKYISRQYLDLCGRSVDIGNKDNEYRVTLPLL